MTKQNEVRRMWWLEPHIPLRVEFENRVQWQVAGKRAHTQPALRLSLLTKRSGDLVGHYNVVETYTLPLDIVAASTRPCLFCGGSVRNSEISVMGFTYHKRCLAGEISPAKAEELKLIATPVEQLKKWIDLAPL